LEKTSDGYRSQELPLNIDVPAHWGRTDRPVRSAPPSGSESFEWMVGEDEEDEDDEDEEDDW
jgi:hypothetical protein